MSIPFHPDFRFSFFDLSEISTKLILFYLLETILYLMRFFMRVGILPEMFADAQDDHVRDHEMSKCFVERTGL